MVLAEVGTRRGVVQGVGETQEGGLQFPAAVQPDILRSSMKDDFYRKMLYSSTLDLVPRSLGTHGAHPHEGSIL
jgi:hypothetical protein